MLVVGKIGEVDVVGTGVGIDIGRRQAKRAGDEVPSPLGGGQRSQRKLSLERARRVDADGVTKRARRGGSFCRSRRAPSHDWAWGRIRLVRGRRIVPRACVCGGMGARRLRRAGGLGLQRAVVGRHERRRHDIKQAICKAPAHRSPEYPALTPCFAALYKLPTCRARSTPRMPSNSTCETAA